MVSPVHALPSSPRQRYLLLMAASGGEPVEETLAQIIASWWAGDGALPKWLGLGEQGFRQMMAYHFPRIATASLRYCGQPSDPLRQQESTDLRRLLLQHRTGRSASEHWLADIVVAGCLGSDHLWQDLGLWDRDCLSRLMHDNFAPLAGRNDRDMKWKKFLYKQLCEAEGVYICRSPSCEVCVDYAFCFGPEE